jgi:crotonobetaine/carnitine-CoA ligase
MFHSGAWLLNVFPSLIYGLPVGLEPRFSVGDFWPSVRRHGATQIFTLSAMHIWLLNQPERADDLDNPARVWTAVPLAPGAAEPLKRRFGLQAMFSAYGSTEAMPMTIGNVHRPGKEGSSGWAQPNLEVQIVDEDDVVQPPGAVGEIVVRPKTPYSLFSGYHNQPEATLATLRNLWLHTGDLGRFDEDGELFFVDRKADYMRRRGENISSCEVEQAVCLHPAVLAAAVHSVPASDSEDEVKLCVVLLDGVTLEHAELAAFCAENLPYYVVPRYIEYLDDLPRTPTERVQKHLLRERGITAQTWDAEAAGFKVAR